MSSSFQSHEINELEQKLLAQLDGFFDGKGEDKRVFDAHIRNIDRTFGTRTSYEISIRHGEQGLPDGRTLEYNLKGHAGQSFCALLAKGITVRLIGDANDYVGKCLSGGKIIIRPPKEAKYTSEDNTIIGNVALYGATSGK